MRLWLVGRRSSKRRMGGDALQVEESAELGRAAGYDVVVEPRASRVRPEAGDRVHLFNLQRCLDWGDLPERSAKAGARLLLTPLLHPTDVYHRHGRRGLDGLAARLVPDSKTYAGLRWGGRSLVGRARELAPLLDTVLLSHVREADVLLDELGIELRPDQSRVVPVAIPGRSELPAPEAPAVPSGDYVLCAGRVEPLKNSQSVAEVCDRLGLPVVFAGPGPGRRHLGYARELLSGPAWLGVLAYPRLRATMAGARVHVLASWAEVVGRATLEAALAGAAVVLSDVGYAPDYLGRGTEGVFLFEPGDEAGLADALSAAWERGRRPESELVERVRAHYTWDAVGPSLIEAWSA